jgi:hypothetical protein
MGPFGVVCAHAGVERIANTPAVETAADFRNCRLDLVFMVFMAKSPALSDGPSFLEMLERCAASNVLGKDSQQSFAQRTYV